ncbi:hypothetical protein [Gilliamella apis]|uniref:hypothetical protein n=1 Tax=Gilliamella apis TaxID=1970738 RepID=UPI001054B8F1|nr:hypothetical protein [Gilliamella apis]
MKNTPFSIPFCWGDYSGYPYHREGYTDLKLALIGMVVLFYIGLMKRGDKYLFVIGQSMSLHSLTDWSVEIPILLAIWVFT